MIELLDSLIKIFEMGNCANRRSRRIRRRGLIRLFGRHQTRRAIHLFGVVDSFRAAFMKPVMALIGLFSVWH